MTDKVINVIQNHDYPYIGNKPIESIMISDILNIIDRINQKGLFGSAEKLMSNFNRIYKFAVTYNYVKHNIIADKNIIISTRNNHYPAITNENEIKEINFETEVLDIPADKMKTKKDFIMPLSKQAIEILKIIEPFSAHKSINDATLNHALMKLGYKNRHCTHGFKSTFSTICHEKTKEHGFSSDIIESSLAHEERNQA